MTVLFDIFFILVCLLLIFMVVITPSQSEGLAGAFGGMGSDTFFGTKAHQHISKFTMGLAVSFIVLAILINLWMSKGNRGTSAPFTPKPQEKNAPVEPQPK